MDDLHEIGLKMREWRFKELSSSSGGAMSLTPIPIPPTPPPPPSRKVHLWGIFFALPAEHKFKETDTEQESQTLERKPKALYTDNNYFCKDTIIRNNLLH